MSARVPGCAERRGGDGDAMAVLDAVSAVRGGGGAMKQERLDGLAARMRWISRRLPAIAAEIRALFAEAEELRDDVVAIGTVLIAAYPDAEWIPELLAAFPVADPTERPGTRAPERPTVWVEGIAEVLS